MQFHLLLAILLSAQSVFSLTSGLKFPSRHQLIEYENQVRDFSAKYKVPCLVAGFFQEYSNGDWERVYETMGGRSDIENDGSCWADSILRIGQVSQALESILIAQYVDNGPLSWDDDVHEWIPEKVFPIKFWDNKMQKITIRQLLMHQGGLRGTTLSDLSHYYGFTIFNTTGTIAMFADDPLYAQSGLTFKNSNNGINLIAAIIEQIEQRPFFEVAKEFFRNNNLQIAEMDTDTKMFTHRVTQYKPDIDENGVVKYIREPVTDSIRPYPHWAAEGVVSNLADLLIFSQRLLDVYNGNRTTIKKETLRELWEYKTVVGHMKNVTMSVNGTEIEDIQHYYVMGWERYEFPEVPEVPQVSGLTMLFNTAKMESASSIMAIFPDKNFTVSVSANLGGVDELFPEMVVNSFNILYNEIEWN